MQKNKKAFTLVELIVVITILAILWTIAFVSFGKYNTYSRDVVRVSDIANIKWVLELWIIETWNYPKPDNSVEITYKDDLARYQWNFWKDSRRATKRLDKVPIDPLTNNEYTYSVTQRWNEYELSGIFEWDDVVNTNILNNDTYADSSNYKAYISWNYNGYLKLPWGCEMIVVPSLITTSTWTITKTLESLITNKEIVVNWYKNLPWSYWIAKHNIPAEVNFINQAKAFTWTCDEIKTEVGQRELISNIKSAYTGTLLANNSWIKEILNSHNWNDLYIAQNIIKANIDKNFGVTALIWEPIIRIAMQSCPNGWTDLWNLVIIDGRITYNLTFQWVETKMCESSWTEIVTWTKVVMQSCPNGWTDLWSLVIIDGRYSMTLKSQWFDTKMCEKD
jgi:prepilin-type N-terminal cleavage/methylation domain-containing protein